MRYFLQVTTEIYSIYVMLLTFVQYIYLILYVSLIITIFFRPQCKLSKQSKSVHQTTQRQLRVGCY